MSLNRISKFAVLLVGSIALSLFAAHAQTGNTGGSSGGASYSGDPDRNPYAGPTPTDITDGGKAEPSGTPKHHRNRNSGHKGSAKITPSPSPSR